MTHPQTDRIRELNDQFRATGSGGDVNITQGILHLPDFLMLPVIERVRTFDAFTPDNDPHDEHDFGAFTIEGHKVFWKIDYYSLDAEGELDCDAGRSEDPSDPAKTARVLTIMLAEEY